MAEIQITAASPQELTAVIGQAWKIINLTGGLVCVIAPLDDEPEVLVRKMVFIAGDEEAHGLWERLEAGLEILLWPPQAGETELRQLFHRVRQGEDVNAAWAAVEGPSYHYWQWRRAFRSGTGMGESGYDVDPLASGLLEIYPSLTVRHLPVTSEARPGQTRTWSFFNRHSWDEVLLRSRDGNVPFAAEQDYPLRQRVLGTVEEALLLLTEWLKPEEADPS